MIQKRCTVLHQRTSFSAYAIFIQPNIVRQACKFLSRLLTKPSSCRTSMIRSSRSTILLKFGSEVPLTNIRNQRLSLRIMSGSKVTEGLRLTEAHIKVFEGIVSKEQRVATTRQGIAEALLW